MLTRDKDLWKMAAENLSQSSRLPSLDLHGLSAHIALGQLEEFLNSQFMAGEEAVKVICGIGTGKLMQTTENLLKEYKHLGLVEDYIKPKSGGVFIVRLSPKEY